jgi:hypothetical protein
MFMSMDGNISRRTYLKGIAVFAGAAAAPSPLLVASANSAEVKVSQSMVHYQNNPNQGQKCAMCKSFIPAGSNRNGMMGQGGTADAGSCKLVEGRISPMAWCILYAPK